MDCDCTVKGVNPAIRDTLLLSFVANVVNVNNAMIKMIAQRSTLIKISAAFFTVFMFAVSLICFIWNHLVTYACHPFLQTEG